MSGFFRVAVESQGGGSKKSRVVSLRMSGAELLKVKNLGTADDGLSEGLSTQWQTHGQHIIWGSYYSQPPELTAEDHSGIIHSEVV